MREFLGLPLELEPEGMAELSSICPVRVTQFHWVKHIDAMIFLEAWRYIVEQYLNSYEPNSMSHLYHKSAGMKLSPPAMATYIQN